MIKIYLTIEMESKMSAMKVIQIISDAEAETIETIKRTILTTACNKT